MQCARWLWYYEGKSVNKSKIDIKPKTCDIRTWKKLFISRHILTNIDTFVPWLYQCFETRSIEVFWLLSQALSHLRFNHFVLNEIFVTLLGPVVDRFTRQTFPTVNRKHMSLWISFALNPFAHITHNWTLLFWSILLKYGRHFDYWNHPRNMSMLVCYLDCHEAGLCC
jgi:hypothetical protein